MKYIRFKSNNKISWGILEGNNIKELSGNYVLSSTKETNNTFNINDVEMLSPVDPGKVIAIGLNYKSHLGDRPAPEVLAGHRRWPGSADALKYAHKPVYPTHRIL